MAIGNEFDDLMPHRIRARRNPTLGKDGRKTWTGGYTIYKCLFEDEKSVRRSETGETVTYSRVAYVNSLGSVIDQDTELSFTDGTKRNVARIATHYDDDGTIHNVTVFFE